MSFVVCSYNILANAYIEPRFFPYTAVEHLRPEWRMGALAEAIEQRAAQILCLQEIEAETFALLERRLAMRGYAGAYLKKSGTRLDGCATFFDRSLFSLGDVRRLVYDDGIADQPPSGSIALLLTLRHGARTLGVANTHLKWQAPTTPPDQRIGLRQARQMVGALQPCDAWIACGDFNATSATLTLDTFWSAGFVDAYASRPDDFTCNSNEIAKRIDYLLYRGPLRAEPHALPPIHATTPLPSLEQPSDHLAISAAFEWQ
jgi:endonuclease/exonuclease/phosphatase family metal-dependent hydrolase